jgi:PAS domain S-box-containing protein
VKESNMAVRLQTLRVVPTLDRTLEVPTREHSSPVAEVGGAPDPSILEDAIENTHDCIALVDMSGNVTYMNFSGLCQLGLDAHSLVGQIAWSHVWSRECIDLVEYSLESVRLGRACRIFVHRGAAQGGKQWWDIAASPVFELDGVPKRMFCVCRVASPVTAAEPVAVVPMSQTRVRDTDLSEGAAKKKGT